VNQQAFSQLKEFKLSVTQPPKEQCVTSGIDKNKINHIKIFPNPSSGIVNIEFTDITAEGRLTIQINTLDGRLVYFHEKQKSECTNPEKLDISELPKGMYLLKLTEDGNFYYDRIVLY
jgi:hypothetical protein